MVPPRRPPPAVRAGGVRVLGTLFLTATAGCGGSGEGGAGGDAPGIGDEVQARELAGDDGRVAPAPATPWSPDPAEVLPDAKSAAARIAEALLYEPERGPTGRVLYPQLVGAAGDSVAITVLVEEVVRDGSPTRRRVMDIRLRLQESEWRFDAIRSDTDPPPGLPAGFPPPSGAARAVLDHPRIHIPDTGRADLLRGEVSDELLALLLRIGERHEIEVLTLSGHRPRQVFGTDRASHHSVGRAVDIHVVDGLPVLLQRERGSPAHQLVTWLFGMEGIQIGSPWALDGFGGRSFTDLVHQDHIHVAVPP